MGAIRRKSLADPDNRLETPGLGIALTEIGSHLIGYGVVQPGWRWSVDLQPSAGTPSCQVHHVQVFLSGRSSQRPDPDG